MGIDERNAIDNRDVIGDKDIIANGDVIDTVGFSSWRTYLSKVYESFPFRPTNQNSTYSLNDVQLSFDDQFFNI